MALETMASLSTFLSPSLSPSPSPSHASLKRSTCTFPSSLPNQLKMTKNYDDVINRVVYPSLANANLLFHKSGYYNVEMVPQDGESEEQLVSDFKRSVFRAGVLQEARRRRRFENNHDKRIRKTKEAAKKYRKRRPIPKAKPTPETSKNRSVGREVEEDDDNWELPPEEIEIPYTNRF